MFKKTQYLSSSLGLRRAQFAARIICLALAGVLVADQAVRAQQVQWIWASEHKPDQIPQTSCYFRKAFKMLSPEQGQLQISANDRCEIYLNGGFIGTAEGSDRTTRFDLSGKLVSGINVIAVQVDNTTGTTAGLAAALVVKEKDESKWRMLPTGESWRASIQPNPEWKNTDFIDSAWIKCQVVRSATSQPLASNASASLPPTQNDRPDSPALSQNLTSNPESPEPPSETLPDDRQAINSPAPQTPTEVSPKAFEQQPAELQPAELQPDQTQPAATAPTETQSSAAPRSDTAEGTYTISSEFAVNTIIDSTIGSLIAMEFDEWGRLICSVEGGGLVRIDFRLPEGNPNRIKTICDQVNSCQGILPLNGNIYVTGQGPEGLALYRLSDSDNNGSLDQIKTLLKFTGSLGEHGPHGLALGPDGFIYVVIGNASGASGEVSETSPYATTYEADIVPRVEDPGGHAIGVKAPGGTIARIRLDGSDLEIYAGGIRNAYDLAFDVNGELFIHDSDMETDVGAAWYRPTMVFQVQPGSEIGWRSGWATFATHQPDCIAPVAETGRGSPTGIVAYNHLAFPRRYHNSLFLGDWSEGRILNVSLREKGGNVETRTEVFLQSRPLNVTDLAVGPDGALYFCTGGRGTSGGVFRISWLGEVPAQVMKPDSRLLQLLTFPQPQSAWARQALAKTKLQMGDEWKTTLEAAAVDNELDAKLRVRALDLLTLYGPAPSKALIRAAAEDPSPTVRARAALIMGMRSRESVEPDLIALLDDISPWVRRVACDSLARIGAQPALQQIADCLRSPDRSLAFAARRLLEKQSSETWRDESLRSDDLRVVIQASLALMIAEPNTENAYRVLARSAELMNGFISDADFMDLMRVVQLALTQGQVDPANIPAFVQQMAAEFPTKNPGLNGELAKILAYLQATDVDHRYATYFAESTDPDATKLFVAMMLQTMAERLSVADRQAVLLSIEQGLAVQGAGGGYYAYLSTAADGLARLLTKDELDTILEHGAQWPHAMVAAFYMLPEKLTPELVDRLIEIDETPIPRTDSATRKMHAGILALLSSVDNEKAAGYMRKVWQVDETRRNDVALALAQRPEGDNWAYLVSSLSNLDKDTAGDVLMKLKEVNRRPRDGKYYRELIQLAMRLKDSGAIPAIALLEHWTGQQITTGDTDWQSAIQAWKKWYEREFPSETPISAPGESRTGDKWSVSELTAAIVALDGSADVSRGQRLFSTAHCAKCHRYGTVGDSLGPDLTSLAGRFSRVDMIDAMLNPSKHVSDQYRGRKLTLSNGQTVSGLLAPGMNDSLIVLQADGERVKLLAEDVEEISELKQSSMPEGLLDKLSARDVADLIHFLESQPMGRVADNTKSAPSESR